MSATSFFRHEPTPARATPSCGHSASRQTCTDGERCRPPWAEEQLATLLAQTPGQVLTTLPGVAIVSAAAFSAYTLPIERFPSPEHLYSATGLAPASYQSSTITRRGRISR